MEKLKLDVDLRSKALAIRSIVFSHEATNFGEYWLLYDCLATMDHIKKIFPLGKWSRDPEGFLWFTLKEENHE